MFIGIITVMLPIYLLQDACTCAVCMQKTYVVISARNNVRQSVVFWMIHAISELLKL